MAASHVCVDGRSHPMAIVEDSVAIWFVEDKGNYQLMQIMNFFIDYITSLFSTVEITFFFFIITNIFIQGKPFRQSCSTMVPCIKIHNIHKNA